MGLGQGGADESQLNDSGSVACWRQGGRGGIRYIPSLLIQKHFVYILQLAVHTVQRNWISRLGRYIMGEGGGVPGQGWSRGWAGWRWLGTVYVNVLCDLKARMGACP